MASSSEVYDQIQRLLGQTNPLLEGLPEAGTYYKDRANKAFEYNKGPLENVSELEKKMYSMPGELMNQYDTEFGGKLGVSSNQRINSILSQLGNQSGVVNTARGLANQAGTRIDDMAETLLNQYKTAIDAKQMQLSPLLNMWDRLFSEEQANARARRSGGSSYVSPWGDITYKDNSTAKKETKKTSVVSATPNLNINAIPQPTPTPAPNIFNINPLGNGYYTPVPKAKPIANKGSLNINPLR